MGIFRVLLVFCIWCAPILIAQVTFCDDYTRCMEELEVKQHECLALDRNVKLKHNDECTRKKWDKKLELNALHMRRAEIARDCVQKSHLDSAIAESTLDAKTHKSCLSLHQKFQFAKLATSSSAATSSNRKKRTATRRNKRETKRLNNSQTKAQECRAAAKIWHKQCAALAECCPLVEDCKQSTQEIMEQIYEGRHKLHQMHDSHCH